MEDLQKKKTTPKIILQDQDYEYLTIAFLISFLIYRAILFLIYSFPFNLYCGDSAYYLNLARHLEIASADRPSGYPMILSLFLPIIYKNWYAIPLMQSMASFATLIYTLKVLKGNLSKFRSALWVVFAFFNYHIVFMEKSIMPDSIAYTLLLLGSVMIFSGRHKCWWNTIIIGLIAGFFPLLRTNYLVFSLLFILILIIKYVLDYNSVKKFIINIGLIILPFLIIYLGYTNLFLYPRLGVRNISSFGGRTLFSRVMVYTPCNVLKKLNLNKEFAEALTHNCDDSKRTKYSSNLFSETGLIKETDKSLALNRAKSDILYMDAAKKILSINPFVLFRVFWESMEDTFSANTAFYRTNLYPRLGGGCETLPQDFGTTNETFISNNNLNKNKFFITILSILAALSQKIIVLILYIAIPIWFVIKFISNKPIIFVKNHWESVIIWIATLSYFSITLVFTGFDYRYIQPLWLTVVWIIMAPSVKDNEKHF